VAVEGDAVGVVGGDVEMDPGDASLTQCSQVALDKGSAQTLTADAGEQVDVQMGRVIRYDRVWRSGGRVQPTDHLDVRRVASWERILLPQWWPPM
jgi:hypothetical protein